jgi:hypothetical protein
MEKRTLDFQASHMCKSRQGKYEKIYVWIQRIQTLGLLFVKRHC